MTKILCFSTLYPNQQHRNHGIFVENRLRHTIALGEIEATVLAPVPFFPFNSHFWGRYAKYARVPKVEDRNGIRIYHPDFLTIPRVGAAWRPRLLAMSARKQIIRMMSQGFEFDVIDAHYFYPDGVAASLLADEFQKPLVITARGSDLTQHALIKGEREQIISAARKATALVTVSNSLKLELVKLGISPSRIAVLRNGVETDTFCFKPPKFGNANAQQRLFSILSVGALIPRKAHDIAIRAMPLMPDCELKIIGSGELRSDLSRLADELGVSDRVHLLGEIAHHDLPNYYSAADTMVLMSSREGWANVILESLACGTPVLASDVGGASEIIRSPVAGHVIEQRTPQSLAQALASLRRNMPQREATRKYAESFGWRPVAQANSRLLVAAAKAKHPLSNVAEEYSVSGGTE